MRSIASAEVIGDGDKDDDNNNNNNNRLRIGEIEKGKELRENFLELSLIVEHQRFHIHLVPNEYNNVEELSNFPCRVHENYATDVTSWDFPIYFVASFMYETLF
jgi:hypothetical protein